MVLELGDAPRSGVTDLREVASIQPYVSVAAHPFSDLAAQNEQFEGKERTHFIALIIGGGPHIKTL